MQNAPLALNLVEAVDRILTSRNKRVQQLEVSREVNYRTVYEWMGRRNYN